MPDELTTAAAAIKYTLDLAKSALDVIRGAKDLMPDGDAKQEVDEILQTAQDSADQATALLAHELGYTLCKCEFPPTPTLFQRHDRTTGREISKCPKCNSEYPPELDPISPVQRGGWT